MISKYRFFPLYFIILVLCILFLTGCTGEAPPPSQAFTMTSIAMTDLPVDMTVTATNEPTLEIVEDKKLPEPTATDVVTLEPEEKEIPTNTPDLQEETQGDSDDQTGDSVETEPTPTPVPPSTENDPVSKDCLEKAAFYADVTVPDGTFFHQGDDFTKTWRFRNEGTCTWTTDYSVVFHSGDNMSAPIEIPFSESVLPGELVDMSVDMKAPTRGGNHQSNWEFADSDGVHFGAGASGKDLFWVLISVRFLDQNDEPQPDPSNLPPPSSPSGCSPKIDRSYESQVVTLINRARNQNGLSSLTVSSELSASALAHSTDMACNDFVGHAGSDGSHWTDRMAVQGYSYTNATENIYVGFPDFGGKPDGAFEWWMNSQVHRNNILDPNVSEIGVGYIFTENSSYGGYYTINFAQP